MFDYPIPKYQLCSAREIVVSFDSYHCIYSSGAIAGVTLRSAQCVAAQCDFSVIQYFLTIFGGSLYQSRDYASFGSVRGSDRLCLDLEFASEGGRESVAKQISPLHHNASVAICLCCFAKCPLCKIRIHTTTT